MKVVWGGLILLHTFVEYAKEKYNQNEKLQGVENI